MLRGAATRASFLAAADMYPAHAPDVHARWLTLPDGERVRIVEAGDPSAPPVLLLHGWGCSAFTWRHVTPSLAAEGWHAIAIDLRGHGLSDRPADPSRYRIEAMIQQLRAIMDALGVERAPVIAHSMGGAVAVGLCLETPQRIERLALFAPVGFGVVDRATLPDLLPANITGALLPSRIPRWVVRFALKRSRAGGGIEDESEVDEYWAPTQWPDFLEAMRLLLHNFTWRPWTPTELASIRVPVMLVFGDRDPVVRPQPVVPTLARSLRVAELHVAKGAGHVIPEERPAWSLELLRSFLGEPPRVTSGG